ncbi:acyl carrier protein [Mediterraneibacter glycyrrhizinilyticus]|uniref:phosphopantetheine-binding protein n=1 Tax=Mediterraneibacter glycyrrhizinilyticus TaxID=342942 RepID=UPI0019611442|nr:acyl carrier protein [Mediterraneibacter glycyrrhizinilyticus]MBM6750051.1 acyl carrier protein [Mediterraneibacter glycyrrhizinilyticus]
MKANETQVIDILKAQIEELEDIDIRTDTPLISSGYIESFDVITVIAEFERVYNLTIKLETLDIADFNTVGSIVSLLNQLIDNKK